jgi:ring-1,2-phenylacetyl-CoA epoxidase subunit PaaE
MSAPHFHTLKVKRIEALTAQSAAISLAIPPELYATFAFTPGQFITLRTKIQGESLQRSYSLYSTPAQLAREQEISVGIKRVQGGVFSSWVTTALQVGDTLDAMPPDGRFTPKAALINPQGSHRLGIAAGSGITPILSIMAHTLSTEPGSRFTLLYGNQRGSSIMFNEALQDLKDRYPERLSLVHMLSRQPGEVALLHGRLDETKVSELLRTLVPTREIDEVFICGPETMIEQSERALRSAGVAKERVHAERFASGPTNSRQKTIKSIATNVLATGTMDIKDYPFALNVVLDGKTHSMGMHAQSNVLDTALEAGLDLPYACKGGVCCTCRAKVLEGQVRMEKNFTLEQWEIDKGFVLTCQAHCVSKKVIVSYDER